MFLVNQLFNFLSQMTGALCNNEQNSSHSFHYHHWKGYWRKLHLLWWNGKYDVNAALNYFISCEYVITVYHIAQFICSQVHLYRVQIKFESQSSESTLSRVHKIRVEIHVQMRLRVKFKKPKYYFYDNKLNTLLIWHGTLCVIDSVCRQITFYGASASFQQSSTWCHICPKLFSFRICGLLHDFFFFFF